MAESNNSDALILSVRLSSGRFETTLRVPFPCSVDEGHEAIMRWLDFAMTGFRIGAEEMQCTFDKERRLNDD